MSNDLDVEPPPGADRHSSRQILVLHGGGYRGLYTARVIEKLEEAIGHPILDAFDMVAGTSIGGIIALVLASEMSGKSIRETIESRGPSLFPDHGWLGRRWQFLKRLAVPPHQQQKLKDLIADVVDPDKLLHQFDIEIVIPALDASGSAKGPTPIVFNNHVNSRTRSTKLIDVALSTSAAPTYFASHQMPESRRQLVDGGVIANSPSWIALTMALAEYGWQVDTLRMLIIGTTQSPVGRIPKPPEKQGLLKRLLHPIRTHKRWHSEGLFYWLKKGRLLSLLMEGQQRLADQMCLEALETDNALIIDSFRSKEQDKVAAALNQASTEATNTLQALADDEVEVSLANPSLMRLLRRTALRNRAT